MISFSNVTKRYAGSADALSDISLAIEPGEAVVVTGHSGAGKTTLLKLMAAIELPSAGTVIINGQNTRALKVAALPFLRRRFGIVFQDHKLLPDRSVLDNVLLPLQIAGFDRRDAGRRARAALDKVGLLGKERALPITLSGGEQQRVCIARAVVHRPAVLLADEPTGNLDEAYAIDIMELFRSFNQVGVTLVLATHDRLVRDRLRARTIELSGGRLDGAAGGVTGWLAQHARRAARRGQAADGRSARDASERGGDRRCPQLAGGPVPGAQPAAGAVAAALRRSASELVSGARRDYGQRRRHRATAAWRPPRRPRALRTPRRGFRGTQA